MTIIASINLKGGVGKSTIAVNLGCSLASRGLSVAVVDADPQGTALSWAADGKLPVRVIPLVILRSRDSEGWIKKVQGLDDDYVIVDLPPHMADASESALILADLCLVPVTPSAADLTATQKALELMREVREARGNGKPSCLLVPSKVDRRTAAGREIESALGSLGEPIGSAIGQRSAFVDSYTVGEWVGTFAAGSKAHEEIEALTERVMKCAGD